MARRLRLGIRAQLTLTVLLAALLSTGATLFIARNALSSYAFKQSETQASESMSIAWLVMQTQYGQNISISSDSGTLDNNMVLDSPTVGRDQGSSFTQGNKFGKYPLNGDTDYVDAVEARVHGAVSVYQCADKDGNRTSCMRISTTFTKASPAGTIPPRDTGGQLCNTVVSNLQLAAASAPHEWVGEDPGGSCGSGFFGDYKALYNPQDQFIGVLYVGEPLDAVTTFENSTALELLLLGVIVMTAGAILALLFASAIVNALQRAARHVSSASERIAGIAVQQSGGAAQQVWAVNAVNKALQGFQQTARDVAQRTDQLAIMGNQVISRRAEIAPSQIDSILAFMTRSVREISTLSRQQASQFDRMAGAMQAVIEIAEQVDGNSQLSQESAERLQLVVQELQQLVGVSAFRRRTAATSVNTAADLGPRWDAPQLPSASGMRMQGMGNRQSVGVGAGVGPGIGMYGSTWQDPYGANGYAGYQDASAYGNGDGYGNGSGNGYGNGNGYGADPSGRAGQAGWNMPPMPPLPPMSQGAAGANYPDRAGYGMRGGNGAMGNSASYRGQMMAWVGAWQARMAASPILARRLARTPMSRDRIRILPRG